MREGFIEREAHDGHSFAWFVVVGSPDIFELDLQGLGLAAALSGDFGTSSGGPSLRRCLAFESASGAQGIQDLIFGSSAQFEEQEGVTVERFTEYVVRSR